MGEFGTLRPGFGLGSRPAIGPDWARWSAGLTAAQMLDIDYAKLDRHFQNTAGSALADDPGEAIALSLDSASWGGLTLDAEVTAQSELKATGTIGIVGTTTAATYNTSSGAGTVSRTTYPTDQSYVTFPVTAGAYYEIDLQCTNLSGVSVRAGTATVNLINTAGDTTRRKYRIASTSSELMIFAAANSTSIPFTVFSLKLIPGNHATQATAASQPARQAGGVSRHDGTADNLLTTFLAANGPMTLLYSGTVPATLGAVQAVMGSSGSSANRCWLGVNTSGFVCAGVGSQTESTIVGTKDVRGKSIVAALTFDGATVKLFLRVDGATTQEYTAAQASTPTTTIPFRVGAYNNNGTAASFAAIDAKSFKAARKAMTLQEFGSIASRLA